MRLDFARRAVFLVFGINGLLFATLFSRLPDIRSELDLDNGSLGLLLLATAAGSVLGLPLAGRLIERTSARTVVLIGAWTDATGLCLVGVGAAFFANPWLTAIGLFGYGLGTGVWDVAMNVEGAEVERALGRSIMPRFHAAWSVGSIAGAGIGVVMTAASLPMPVHIGLVCAIGVVLLPRWTRDFLPASATEHGAEGAGAGGSPWLEPRTIAIGLMVLSFAVVEGSANDWLSLALIDGYDVKDWVGVAGFAVFVSAMTVGRLAGPIVLDRYGRAPVLWASSATAAVGIVAVVFGTVLPVVVLGILLWGLGAALGFPVGMSAAADDPVRSAARVSVVATVGYAAFLAGPPLLGHLGDRVGTLEALLAVAFLMVPAAISVGAARHSPQAASAG